MIEILTYSFMQRAFVGGIIVGLLASYYGVFVVQRRMSFMGNGLAHAAFGGVALGLLIGLDPLWVALPFTVAVAAGIVWVQDRARIAADTSIGIFFAVSMALGAIFLWMRESYQRDAFSYLFGSILSVSWSDVAAAAGALGLAAATLPAWKRWAYATFDRDLALADRLPVKRDDYLLAISIAFAVVVSIKLVGIVLVAAFIVLPAATARLISGNYFGMTLASMLLGVLSVIVGLFVSYYADLPTGPTIVLVQATGFFAGLIFRR